MNENEVNASYNDDWDDITLTDDDLEEGAEPAEEEEAPEAEDTADQPEAEAEETAAEPEQTETDQSFELKHLDEVRTVNRDEVIQLAQKGMDYDRVRGKYDEAKPQIEWYAKNATSVKWMEAIAQKQGMTFEELVDQTRAQIMADETNQSLAVCRGIVANERKAAELEKEKARMDTPEARKQRDIQDFIREYPEQAKNPEALPKEVWAAVNRGETLVNAYRAFELKEVKAQLEQQKIEAARKAQEEKNRARSTGSLSTSGKRTADAEFDAIWYDGT